MKHKKEHKEHGSMRGFPMPKDHKEMSQGEMGHESNLRYAGEFSNPHDLDKSTQGLASFAKKHKMQY